jgi:hypothetical protein
MYYSLALKARGRKEMFVCNEKERHVHPRRDKLSRQIPEFLDSLLPKVLNHKYTKITP